MGAGSLYSDKLTEYGARAMTFHSAREILNPVPNVLPTYSAEDLTRGADQARIVLGDQTYILRITRAGKLILTK